MQKDAATSAPPDAGSPDAAAVAQAKRDRSKLVVIVLCAAAVLFAAEWAGSRMVTRDAPTPPADAKAEAKSAATSTRRPQNVTVVLKDATQLPAPANKPSVWLLGNSHTYALPGIKQGDPLRTEAEGILIDELATRSTTDFAPEKVDFFLLSYPNFLPFEMLTRVGHLLYKDQKPNVVFIGLTWRNIARDSQLRFEVYQTYRDGKFCDAFERMLAEPAIHADPEILEEVAAQRRRVTRDEEIERLKSDADRMDEVLTAWISSHSTLMGHSAELRAQIFRTMVDRVQRMWDDRTTVKYTYDLVEHDYKFNVACLRATVRLLRTSGATVICYYAPERSDLPPLLDPEKQKEFFTAFEKEAEELGITILDARPVVPNEYWGWVDDSPDRSHFTEPGHQLLAEFLLEQARQRGLWKERISP